MLVSEWGWFPRLPPGPVRPAPAPVKGAEREGIQTPAPDLRSATAEGVMEVVRQPLAAMGWEVASFFLGSLADLPESGVAMFAILLNVISRPGFTRNPPGALTVH
jgi:hypothetical protein